MADHDDDVRLLFIWMPMVPGDGRAAAIAVAGSLSDARTMHLWDPERSLGLQWTRHFVPRHLDELRQALRDKPEVGWLLDELAAPEPSYPVWDCALFFRPGAAWSDRLPAPDGWMKQFEYWRNADGGNEGGAFWTEYAPTELLRSTWPAQFDQGMAGVISSR